uniref:Pentacotripeptide-repeat region of PRORP domain-containing protein n=1 Tax=Aureoumbra lagunensis TaxID=44058 RepID=A0A7S3K5G8_9STRA|mmetsp:Transcript_20217/g.30820  ORF Transcript_20217/g.30820 Transcript_20217/m.30820 type:complete len:599 (+) Transcript_20217:30-1826(+)
MNGYTRHLKNLKNSSARWGFRSASRMESSSRNSDLETVFLSRNEDVFSRRRVRAPSNSHVPVTNSSLLNRSNGGKKRFIMNRRDILRGITKAKSADEVQRLYKLLQPFATDEENITVIERLGKLGLYEEAITFLEEVQKEIGGNRVNPQLVKTGIEVCSHGGLSEKAIELMSQIEDCKDKTIVLKSYNWALRACAKDGAWERALALLKQMLSKKLYARKENYLSAILACDRSGIWKQAARIVKVFLKDTPYTICTNAAMSACIRHNQPLVALEIFDKHWQKRYNVDPIQYSSSLTEKEALSTIENLDFISMSFATLAARKVEDWTRIPILLDQVKSMGFLPSGTMYTAGILAQFHLKNYAEALYLFDQMKDRKFQMTLTVLNTAMHAATKCNDAKRAVAIIHAAKENKLKNTKKLISAAFDFIEMSNDTESALALFQLDGTTYSPPQAYHSNENSSISIFLHTQSTSISCTKSFNKLLSVCLNGGRWSHVLELFFSDLGNKFQDQHSRALALNAAELGGQWQQAFSIARQAHTLNENPPSSSTGLLTCPWSGSLLPFTSTTQQEEEHNTANDDSPADGDDLLVPARKTFSSKPSNEAT